MFSQHSFFSFYKAPSGLNHTEFTPIWHLRNTQTQTSIYYKHPAEFKGGKNPPYCQKPGTYRMRL